MYAPKALGWPPNQVVSSFRFFVLNLTADPDQSDKELVFIDPGIVKRHSSVEDEEGCFSLRLGFTPRSPGEEDPGQGCDLQGKLVEHEADELFSRAVQA